MFIYALLLSLVVGAHGGGAFGSLWMLDLRRETTFPGHEIFRVDLPGLGANLFAMISSHASQYWFRVDAVYVEDPDAIDDLSDVYCKNLLGQRTLKFIGYFSFLLIMARLMPMFRKGVVPWHEMIIQSNDYKGEDGCTVNVRSSMEPTIWFLRVGEETSIIAGEVMFQNFKTIRLPRLIVRNEWNYSAWKPYYQNSGPIYFVYTPHKTLDFKKTVNQMAIEENSMAQHDEHIHFISKNVLKMIVKAYLWEWEQGRYLSKTEKQILNLCRLAKI